MAGRRRQVSECVPFLLKFLDESCYGLNIFLTQCIWRNYQVDQSHEEDMKSHGILSQKNDRKVK